LPYLYQGQFYFGYRRSAQGREARQRPEHLSDSVPLRAPRYQARKPTTQVAPGTTGISGAKILKAAGHTNRRIISVSKISLVGLNYEWDSGGQMVLQGGNFQIPKTKLDHICFAPSRVKESAGALDAPEEVTKFL
jgi:hypothetical protein